MTQVRPYRLPPPSIPFAQMMPWIESFYQCVLYLSPLIFFCSSQFRLACSCPMIYIESRQISFYICNHNYFLIITTPLYTYIQHAIAWTRHPRASKKFAPWISLPKNVPLYFSSFTFSSGFISADLFFFSFFSFFYISLGCMSMLR
jgi:hypothetical protein